MAITINNNSGSTLYVISRGSGSTARYHGSLSNGSTIQNSDLNSSYNLRIGFLTSIPQTYDSELGQNRNMNVGETYFPSQGDIAYPNTAWAMFSQLTDNTTYDVTSGGSNTVLPAEDSMAPSISSQTISSNGLTVTVTMSEAVYRNSNASGALSSSASDYTIHLRDSSYNDQGDATISSVSHSAGSNTITFTLSSNPGEGKFLNNLSFASGNQPYDQYGNQLTYDAYFSSSNSEFPSGGDSDAPTISSVVCSSNNSQLTVTFNESVYSTGSGSGDLEASDFAVTISGGNASHSGAPTAISKTSQSVWVLTLGNGKRLDEATGGETVSVDSASDTSIYDAAGNAHTAAHTSSYLKVRAPQSISIDQSTPSAPEVTLTFARNMYNTNGASGDLEVSDFVVSMSGGKASMSSGAPASIAKTSQKIWVLTLPTVTNGSSANGHEVVTVAINGDSAVFDPDGNAIDASEFVQNTVRLSQQIDTDQTSGFISFADIRAHKDQFSAMTGKGLQLKDSGVTLAKMADLAAFKVIGNVPSSGSAAATPAAIDVKDEDNMSSNSATALATQQSIKAYVDSQVGGASLEFTGDSGGSQSIDLDSATLDIEGGDGVATTASSGKLSVAIDAKANGGLVIESAALAVDLGASSITGTLAVGDGGTGATSASDARTNLGLAIGSDVQAYDAELAALAGLTSAADKGIQFTGSGSAATYDLTSAGKALLDDADAAAQRITMGVQIGVDVQAYDAELAAIAGLTSAANKGIQFTGDGSAATYDLTAAGKALLDDADAAAQRTTLGLVIGTDVQAFDAELAAIAGLNSAAGKMIEFTGSGSAQVIDVTAAGKALLDDADAAAQRTTMGVAIGSDVQAYDADLAAIAGLTSAADKGIQFTGSGAAATYDLTAAGKALLDDADAAAQRTTLGLVIGTNVQAFDAELAALAGLTSAANKIPYFSGSESAAMFDFKDEDDMSSDSATAIPSQQSVKAYVDSVAQGLDAKDSVRAASTAAVTLSSDVANGDSLDGVTLVTGNRILLKNQSSAAENGIYVVAASGAPTRASDMDGAAEFKGAFFFVEEGTVNANAGFVCTSTGTISVGSSSISFAQFSGAGSIVAGVGLDKSGNEMSVKLSELTAKGANAVAGDSIAIIDSEDSDASKKLTVSNLVGLMDGTGLTASSGVLSVDASQTQITAIGTIATGEWNATDIAIAHGGTGASSASGARTNLGLAIGSDVQAYDAELAAIAGLTSAANKGIQFTGDGTAATYDLTAAGKALLDDADAAAQRITMGVQIGVDVQAFDAELAALAGLTSAADKGIQFTGSGSAATYDLTAAGKALLDDADASAQRTTLGLVIGTDVLAQQSIGIANDNLVEMDDSDAESGDFARFTANGLEGRSASEVRTDLSLVPGTDVQAYDAELAAIAGLTSAADKGIQFTGSGTAAVYDLTAAGKALLDDADAAAQRITMGVQIGVDVQAYDAELAALAGLTSAADKGIQFTGDGTAATYDLTAAGKALLDDASASAQRDTLGLQPKIQFFAPGNYPSSLGSQQALTLDVAVTAEKSCIVFVNGTAIMMALDSSGDPIATQLSGSDSQKYHVSGTTLTLGKDVIDDLDQDFVIVWYMA